MSEEEDVEMFDDEEEHQEYLTQMCQMLAMRDGAFFVSSVVLLFHVSTWHTIHPIFNRH